MLNKNDTHFFVGTIHGHPQTWIIIGLFYPPKAKRSDFAPVLIVKIVLPQFAIPIKPEYPQISKKNVSSSERGLQEPRHLRDFAGFVIR
jgi:hypothetical protein